MFNKQYLLIDNDDEIQIINDLKQLVDSFGLNSFLWLFSEDIEKVGWTTRDDLYFTDNELYYKFRHQNKSLQFCSARYCIRTLSGKKVHPNQVVSEYVSSYPSSPEVKKVERRNRLLYARSSGSKKSTRRCFHLRERHGAKIKQAIRNRSLYEEYEGGKVRLQRIKYERKFADLFEPYSDYYDFKVEQRNWKSYRKTQYKPEK